MELVLTDEVLMAIAQIAIALIGFSGVVVALGKSTERWSETELLQLRTLVEPSLVVLVAVFVPFALTFAEVVGDLMWRASNLAILTFHCIANSLFVIRGLRKSEAVVLSQLISQSMCVVVYVILLCSVFDWFPYHQLAFLLGLLVGVFVSVHNFYLLIFKNEGST